MCETRCGAMALSQCLDDSPGLRSFKRGNDINVQELYNERHRLALEELVAGGVDGYLDFLKKEKIPNFLSDEEIRRISRAAVVPRCGSLAGEDTGLEHSMTSSMDCSSVTYFPEVSDVEPPLLEIGWPAFTTGSYRGVTRAVAHFQPSYGESIYNCKEAVRRMIKSAKERFMLIDGNRVATGSYRFTWTDGRLNSSNLIELSGQITENFDEEFRILYAQSLPLSGRGASGSNRNSGIYDHLLLKQVATPPAPRSPCVRTLEPTLEPGRMTSTPSRAGTLPASDESARPRRESGPTSDSSTIGEGWMEQDHIQEVLTDAPSVATTTDMPAEEEGPLALPVSAPCHSSTQTCILTADHGVQTDPEAPPPQRVPPAQAGSAPDEGRPRPRQPLMRQAPPPHPDGNLRDCFRKLTKERQYHYSSIRSKLDHMVALLSHRRELVDLTNLALSPRLHRVIPRVQWWEAGENRYGTFLAGVHKRK
ncbi:hypothetical protein JZ751_011405 [Albula glossodonta]|uniref:Scaffolding anchor of CK1 domain-containing protein n=1 Tax=Albula glossodonta TaxID=121402 RepID=A0A8T2MKG6_9TELE|nr:hypothetical protein JZ751_011405 [Albula glossodonta]